MRFSLRTLLLAVLIAAIGLWGWLAYRKTLLRTGDLVEIQVIGTLLGQDINGVFLIDELGEVSLGPAYGRVEVAGLNARDAGQAINGSLRRILRHPEVSLVRLGRDGIDAQFAKLQAENRKLKAEVEMLKRRLAQGAREPTGNVEYVEPSLQPPKP